MQKPQNQEPAGRWVSWRENGPTPRLRLFCFPYAGGGATIFHAWAASLPSDVRVCPIQLPGRQNRLRETPFTDLSALVAALTTALDPYLDRPFAIFGHSVGALVAFELARNLRRARGLTPVHLFAAACRAPGCPPTGVPPHDAPEEILLELLRNMRDGALLSAELAEVVLPALRADLALQQRYRLVPEAPLACPLSVFGGADDLGIGRFDLEAWHEHTSGAFRLRMLPGAHLFLETSRDALLATLREDLAAHH